jgi:hypothetical protein
MAVVFSPCQHLPPPPLMTCFRRFATGDLVNPGMGELRFPDTSCASVLRNVHDKPCLALFNKFDKLSGCCGACGVVKAVEVYPTLTRMPGMHGISAERAMPFVGSIRYRLSVIAPGGDEPAGALEAAAYTPRCSPVALSKLKLTQ